MKKINGFTVKRSRNGRGVFTTKSYNAGDRLFAIDGEEITLLKSEYIYRKILCNYFRLGKNDYIDPKEQLAFFVNHSCAPNTKIEKIQGKLYMTAISDLKKGEEVYIDYTTNSAIDDTWSMNCNCGEEKCRGKIGNIGGLPKDVFAKYVRLKIIPKYIFNISKWN